VTHARIVSPRLAALAVLVSSALALSGCAETETALAQAAPEVPAIPVRLASVDRAPTREAIAVPGLVRARDTYDLSFPAGGVLSDVLVDEGDEVHEGQILARIDATAAQASLSQAREGLVRAERDLSRARSLSESGSLPTATFEDATTGAEVARAQVSAAGFAIRYSVLRAPADGWIDARLADPREVAAPGVPVLRMSIRERGWVLRVAVPDRAVARLREGAEAEVRLDALDGRVMPTHVVEIARAPTPGSGSYDVDLALDASDDEITMRTGLVGRASIPFGPPMGASVPLSALVDGRDHEASVFVVADGLAHRRAVHVAFFTGERAVIESGLDDVTEVVTLGADRLDEGVRVTVAGE
jgi:multidrug efflux system membrane fusion protein